MANRNRRNHAKGGGTVLVRCAAAGLLALAVLVLYVGMSNNCEELGRQIKAAENEKNELLKQVATEEQKWAHARSYQQMERLMAQYGIEMDWPEEKDIIRLHVARDGAPVEYARVR